VAQRQVLDALRRPVGPDLVARNSPDLFRVGLEEVPEEPTAEAIRDPLVEGGFLLARTDLPFGVAQEDAARLVRAHVDQRVERLERISEIFVAVEDAAHARRSEEHT